MYPRAPANGAWPCCSLRGAAPAPRVPGAELQPSVPAVQVSICRAGGAACQGLEGRKDRQGRKALTPPHPSCRLARLPRMQVAAQKHPLGTRCPGNCTFKGRGWQRHPAGDDAVAIKSNCLHVGRINFELGGKGRGAGCVLGVGQ